MNVFLVELFDRVGQPFFHVERFIEGDYIKYNSNSGFVEEGVSEDGTHLEAQGYLRRTPQAFSHYTYEQSGKRCMVVDMQGVGDLMTDPQMHTIDQSWGAGDLGATGFAKFFHSHICNPVCRFLSLPEFALEATHRQSVEQERRARHLQALSVTDDGEQNGTGNASSKETLQRTSRLEPPSNVCVDAASRDVLDALTSLKLFAGLSVNDLKQLSPLVALRTYNQGEYVFRHGEQGGTFVVVVSGTVHVVLPSGQRIMRSGTPLYCF
jgi:hypothetical protein